MQLKLPYDKSTLARRYLCIGRWHFSMQVSPIFSLSSWLLSFSWIMESCISDHVANYLALNRDCWLSSCSQAHLVVYVWPVASFPWHEPSAAEYNYEGAAKNSASICHSASAPNAQQWAGNWHLLLALLLEKFQELLLYSCIYPPPLIIWPSHMVLSPRRWPETMQHPSARHKPLNRKCLKTPSLRMIDITI